MGSYDMKSTARCLAALADESRHSFLVSTANLRGPNEIRLLRYSEEDDDVRCVATWHHNYEVCSLSSNAADPTLLATAYSTLDERGARATLWRLTDLHEGGEGEEEEGAAGGGGGGDAAGAVADAARWCRGTTLASARRPWRPDDKRKFALIVEEGTPHSSFAERGTQSGHRKAREDEGILSRGGKRRHTLALKTSNPCLQAAHLTKNTQISRSLFLM